MVVCLFPPSSVVGMIFSETAGLIDSPLYLPLGTTCPGLNVWHAHGEFRA